MPVGKEVGAAVVSEGEMVILRRTGQPWRVGALLGEGSQGMVYELCSVDGSGRRQALKWYLPGAATAAQRTVVADLVDRGSPGPMFLWPTDVVDVDEQSFGYVMPIRPSSYVGLADLLRGRTDPPPSVAVALCLGLAHGFLSLHSQGLCYRDISFGNVLFDPATGAPLICDNDNVGIDGESQSAVLGTRRFMAPEIVRGEALPSTNTDLYSLAVLTFYVLMMHHPLVGRRELAYACFDHEAESVLFGTEPLFVFDPDNHSNAPDPREHAGVLASWPTYPESVHRLFIQAFGDGLTQPNHRVRESVWRAAFARLLDGIATCQACGKENLTDAASVSDCWSCGRAIGRPLRMVLDRGMLVLGARTRLCRHHVFGDYDYSTVLGQVVRHPERDVWGLRNVSQMAWEVALPSRPATSLQPGQAVSLVPETVLRIGPATMRIAP